ncbi:MAG: hypothetical protein AB9891_20550 [Anaerolineaceae bacterium]
MKYDYQTHQFFINDQILVKNIIPDDFSIAYKSFGLYRFASNYFGSPTSSISSTQSSPPVLIAPTGEDASSPTQLTEYREPVLPDCLMNLSYKETAVVLHVTDGDTIVVEIDGRRK